MFFFFKQKTAYEMRISDWSSDVCSSDLMVTHSDVRLASARERFDAARQAYQQSMRVQSQVVGNVAQDAAIIEILVGKSQGAEGALQAAQATNQIGRASCRERVCQYV